MKTINGEDHAFCSVLEDRVDDDWAEPYVMAFADKMLTAKPGEIFTHSTGIDEFRTRQNLAMNTMRQRRNRGGFKSPEPPLEEAPMENPFKVRKIKLDPDAREINLEALIEDSLKDASGPLKERLALKGNRSASEFLLEHVKLAILELEPDLDATSQDFRTAVILMAAAFIVGPRIDLLVAFTGYPRPAVAEISRRMRANGLWKMMALEPTIGSMAIKSPGRFGWIASSPMAYCTLSAVKTERSFTHRSTQNRKNRIRND